MQLRPYQVDVIERLRQEVRNGRKRIILQAQTGSGKTVMASEIIRGSVDRGKKVLFLAHARELVHQCENKLAAFGVNFGTIMAGEMAFGGASVQVASKDTLWSRSFVRKKMDLPRADLVIVDEAHRSLGRVYTSIVNAYPNAIVIGLTATPARGDGRGLGELYDSIVTAASVRDLTNDGYLVPLRVYCPFVPSMKGVKQDKSDYKQDDLQEVMDKPGLVGDVFEHWSRIAPDRPTIIFASGVRHSIHLAGQFNENGVRAIHIDGSTAKDERDMALQRFMDGDVQVLSSCDVLVEGVDLPLASCCVVARPTKSIVKWRQMVGRVHRPSPGKVDSIILDHAGNTLRLGFPDDEIEWSLDESSSVKERNAKAKEDGKVREPVICGQCFYTYSGGRICPRCGHEIPSPRGKRVNIKQGILKEMERGGAVIEPGAQEKERYWKKCLAIAANRAKDFTMAASLFKKNYGHWPNRTLKYPPPEDWKEFVHRRYPGFVRSKA